MVISIIETARKALTNLQGLLGNKYLLWFSSNCQRGVADYGKDNSISSGVNRKTEP